MFDLTKKGAIDQLNASIESMNNTRKTIKMNLLFGSSKPSGVIPRKAKTNNFSHKRIFGK